PVHEVFTRPADLTVARLVGVDTVLPAKVLQVRDGLATVLVEQVPLVTEAHGSTDGEVYVCVRAEEVILEKGIAAPGGTRNRLSGAIRTTEREGPLVRVGLDCGFLLTALVPRQAWEELALREGDRVTAQVPAAAIHLIGRG